ncbi:MAG TPA: hypothetical protein VFT94_01280 [Gaiellaceae bacterium]|nr:hypothetical protein [Gaiellaceae bacterium]
MRALATLVGALLMAGFGAACGSGSGAETTAAPPPPSERSTATRVPAIAGRSLDGARLALTDFRGRPVLVNVWSSW